MGWLAAFVLGAVAAGFIFFGVSSNNRFNQWLVRCHHDNGTVQMQKANVFGDDYECYVNGKIIDHQN